MLNDIADFYYNKGLIYAKKGYISKSIEMMECVLGIDYNCSKARNIIGLCYYRLGEFDKAKLQWHYSMNIAQSNNQAQKYLDEVNSKAFKNMSISYFDALKAAKKKDYSKAIKIMKKNTLFSFDTVKNYNLIGLCYYAKGKTKKALKFWGKALDLDRLNQDTTRYIKCAILKTNKKNWFSKRFFID